MKVYVHQDCFVATHLIHGIVFTLVSCIHDVYDIVGVPQFCQCLVFASVTAIVAIGSDSASVSKINAELCLIPVAHFLATGLYGNKCAAACSKLFCMPFRLLSVLTLAIAACSPASAHWIASS